MILAWPDRGSPAGGLQPRTARKLRTLGRIVNLPLVPPRIPARELVLHPGSGIGPVRLGTRLPTIAHKVGSAIAPEQWAFGPIEVDTQADQRERVDRLVVISTRATIDGHPLSDGYTSLRRELARWHTLQCQAGIHVLLHQDTDGISTRVEFDRGRLIGAFIEAVQASTCLLPFPAG